MNKQPESRRFPLPWTIGGNDACCWVQDADGKRLACCYCLSGTEEISTANAAKLEHGEALRIVRNIAKLPELLKRTAR